MFDGRQVLQRLGEIPGELTSDPRVWVVGGAVRDALLGVPHREIDLVVEGDAEEVARRLGGALLRHERFGTVRVGELDLAAARRETYPRPGALPEVQLGASIDEDLARRDFSVNTLAVRLTDGAAKAWPGALEDLERRVLRILHGRSFLDDPTRLLRMARYRARLRFGPDPETDRAAAEAVRAGAVGTITGSRMGEELRRLLGEPLPAALERLADYGLGDALLPGFELRIMGAADPVVALAACCTRVAQLRERLDDLQFPAASRDAVVAAATRGPQVKERLAAARTPSEVLRVARAERPETVELAGLLGAGENARLWLDELRHLRLAITGDDLVAAGVAGPAVGAGLSAAMEAYADGRAPDRERQLEVALLASRT